MSDQDELIDHYVDRAAVTSDTGFMKDELTQVLTLFNELNGLRLKLNVDSSWKDVSTTTIAAKQATDNLTSSLVTYKAVQQQVAQSQAGVSQALDLSTNSMQKNAELLVQQKLSLAENTANQKLYKEQLDSGKLSLDQYIQKQTDATLRAQEYKTAIADLNKELTLQAKADFAVPNTRNAASTQNAVINRQVGNTDLGNVEQIAALNAQIDENNKLIDQNTDKLGRQKINIGNYPQAIQGVETELTRVNQLIAQGGLTGAEFDDLANKQKVLTNATALSGQQFATTTAQASAYTESAKQIGLAYGVNSTVFKEYNENVGKATAETAKVSDAVKNAGQSSGIFSTQLDKIGQGLSNIGRQIGRLIGIGLIFAGVDALVKFAQYIGDADTRLKDLNDTEANAAFETRAITDAYDGATKELVKAYTAVVELTETFKLAEDGFISKTRAVKDYNDTLGQSFGVVNTLDEAEKKMKDHAQAYIKYTLLKAAAQVTLQKAAEKTSEAAIAAAKPLPQADTDPNQGGKAETLAEQVNQRIKDNRDKEIKAAEAEKKELLKIAQDFYDQAAEVAQKNGLFLKTETLQQQQKDFSDAIELQIQALTRYENKQNQVATEDKNTYEVRRQALLNYNKAQQDLIALQTKQQLLFAIGDPGNQGDILAKQQTQQAAARIQGQQKIEQLDDSYRIRKINALEAESAAELAVTSKSNESIYKDESNSLDARLAAYTAYIAAEKQLADLEFVQKLATVGFSPAEIQAIEDGRTVQIAGKKITNEELEALEVEHTAKMKELAATGGKDIYDIVYSYAKKQEDLAKNENKGNFAAAAQDQYDKQLAGLNNSLEQGLISVTTYNAKRAVVEQQFATARLAAQVDEGQEKEKNLEKVGEDLLEQELFADAALQAAIAGGDQHEITENQKKLDALKAAEALNAADLAQIRKKSAADQVALTEATIKTLLDAKKQEHADELKLEDAAIELIKNLLDAQYQNKITEIESEISLAQKKSQAEVTAEQATTDSAAVQADKIATINDREAQQEAQLTQQENQVKRKEAEVDRIATIAKITQQAIIAEFDLSAKAAQATGTGALLLADPITAPYAPAAFAAAATIAADEIIVAGLAAVNIAAVLASPLPAYKFGTLGKPHPGGLALLGDGGRSELGITKEGDLFRSPSTPTVMDVPEGAYIHPDADQALHSIRYGAFGRPQTMGRETGQDIGRLFSMQKQQTDRIVRAIQDKQELHIQPGFNSLIMIQQYGANYKKWVNRALHHRN